MAREKVRCPWCQREVEVRITREKTDYAGIVVRRCGGCEQVISAYLEEERNVLENVRTFPVVGTR